MRSEEEMGAVLANEKCVSPVNVIPFGCFVVSGALITVVKNILYGAAFFNFSNMVPGLAGVGSLSSLTELYNVVFPLFDTLFTFEELGDCVKSTIFDSSAGFDCFPKTFTLFKICLLAEELAGLVKSVVVSDLIFKIDFRI